MSPVQTEQTGPTDMLPFAKKILELMQYDPSTRIKEFLDLCHEAAPQLGFDRVKMLCEFQERNLGNLQVAAKREGQLAEMVTARQREFMANSIADAQRASGEMLLPGTPMDIAARYAEYLKQSWTKAIEESRAIGEEVGATQTNVSQILFNRANDFLEEINDLIAETKLTH